MMMQQFSTKRLKYRPPKLSDLSFFVQLYGNPEVMKNIPPNGKPSDEKLTKERLDRLIKHWKEHQYGMFLLLNAENDSPVGYCGFRCMSKEKIELGYIIDQPFWSNGIATEAIEFCLSYAKKNFEIPNLVAVSGPKNSASHHILNKFGFKRIQDCDGDYHGMFHYYFEKTLKV